MTPEQQAPPAPVTVELDNLNPESASQIITMLVRTAGAALLPKDEHIKCEQCGQAVINWIREVTAPKTAPKKTAPKK